jgi:hypothetical protein
MPTSTEPANRTAYEALMTRQRSGILLKVALAVSLASVAIAVTAIIVAVQARREMRFLRVEGDTLFIDKSVTVNRLLANTISVADANHDYSVIMLPNSISMMNRQTERPRISLWIADNDRSSISLHDANGKTRLVLGQAPLESPDGSTETTSDGTIVIFEKDGKVVTRLPYTR